MKPKKITKPDPRNALVAAVRELIERHDTYPSGPPGNCRCGNCSILKPIIAIIASIDAK